jgi:O-antigen/teichoic acid export membrane protein
MKRTRSIVVALFVVFFLLFQAGSPAAVENDEAVNKEDYSLALLDLVVARPVGIGLTALGLGAFVVWSPVSMITETSHDAWNKFVVNPACYTFKRPLGHL